MKRIVSNICGLGSLVSLVAAGAETQDGSCCIAWTLSFLALSVILGWVFVKFSKDRRHV